MLWRVSRSILVTETDAQAEEYLADPDNGLSFYYHFFHHSFSKGRKALFMLKPDLLVPDEDVTMDMVKRALVIAGSPRRVLAATPVQKSSVDAAADPRAHARVLVAHDHGGRPRKRPWVACTSRLPQIARGGHVHHHLARPATGRGASSR